MALDLRVWLREIVRRPGTFLAAVSSLAVAISAVTAVLTIVDQTLLRPRHGISDERVVAIRQRDGRDAGDWYRYRDVKSLPPVSNRLPVR